MDIARRAEALLTQKGFKVVLTRGSDIEVSSEERVRIANQYKHAVLISIDFNSSGSDSGIETFALAPEGIPSMVADGVDHSMVDACTGNINDSKNFALATAAHAALVAGCKMNDCGIKRARFPIIRDLVIPGVVIKGGFLSTDYDARLIATPDYRQLVALSILRAMQNYRQAIGPNTPNP